jgi:hypothetical protein
MSVALYAARKGRQSGSGAVVWVAVAGVVLVSFMAVAVVTDMTPEDPPPAAAAQPGPGGTAPASWDVNTPETDRIAYTAAVAVEGCPQLRENRVQWVIATAVAIAESGARPEAHNPNPPDNSYGLWQINMLGSLQAPRLAQYGIASNEELFTPLVNAKAMCEVSGGGANWQPWSVYTNYRFQNHMAEAEAGVAAAESGKAPAAPQAFAGSVLPNSEGLDPGFAQRLAGLAAATEAATGGTMSITSGFRTIQEQRAIIASKGGVCGTWVACVYGNTCGSNHCKGIAADMAWSTDNADDYAHAHLAEWGLKQPMSYEPWHLEPL